MILTGEQIDADAASRIGLVSHIVPREELMDRAHQIAGSSASVARSPSARPRRRSSAARTCLSLMPSITRTRLHPASVQR
jgi:enoyl-CoA hydratase/carnithine racemase